MAAQCFTVSPVTQEQLSGLVKKLAQDGSTSVTAVPGTISISGHGVSATASLQGYLLTVAVVNKPWYITMDVIKDGVTRALGAGPAGPAREFNVQALAIPNTAAPAPAPAAAKNPKATSL